jgi:hypothetical protein
VNKRAAIGAQQFHSHCSTRRPQLSQMAARLQAAETESFFQLSRLAVALIYYY